MGTRATGGSLTQFDFSPVALVAAGGGFLFLLAGLAILALAGRTRLGLRLGLLASSFGATYTIVNIIPDSGGGWASLVILVPGLVATASLVSLIAEVSRPLSSRNRKKLLWLSLGVGASLAVVTFAVVATALATPDLLSSGDAIAYFVIVWLLEPGFLILLAACGMEAGSPSAYRGRLLMGLAAGLFVVTIIMGNAASPTVDPHWTARAADVAALLLGATAVATSWLVLRSGPERLLARRAFAALIVVGLAGCSLALLEKLGLDERFAALGAIFGVLRTFGVVLLAIAIVRYDLLGVPLPRIAMNRGVLAAIALAALFMVAQVMQNFLSAEYGLLAGGAIAGVVLFAANPIQKAIERLGERPVERRRTVDADDEAFRAAAELAFRDRRFTAKEELALAKLATRLGVSAERATEIRHLVERGAR